MKNIPETRGENKSSSLFSGGKQDHQSNLLVIENPSFRSFDNTSHQSINLISLLELSSRLLTKL
jgi:hypothetical protein